MAHVTSPWHLQAFREPFQSIAWEGSWVFLLYEIMPCLSAWENSCFPLLCLRDCFPCSPDKQRLL